MTGTTLHVGDGTTKPTGSVPDSVLLGHKPKFDFVSINGLKAALGASGTSAKSDQERVVAAWANWLAQADKTMEASHQAASDAIQRLQKFREDVGLPQYDPPGSNGWTADMSAAFYGALSTAEGELHRYATEVMAGKRGVTWTIAQDGTGALGIVAAAGDPTFYGIGPNDTVITQSAPQPGQGLGFAPLIVVAGAATLIVGSVAVYLTISKLCETYRAQLASQQQKDMATATTSMLQSGATPEQAQKLVDSIAKAAPAPAPARSENELVSLFKTAVTGVAIIGAVAVVYMIAEGVLRRHSDSVPRLRAA